MERLRKLRQDAGMTQTEIADYLGTSQAMYARYECGKSALPIRHLISLCELYRVSADDVLGLPKRKRRNLDI